MFGAFWSSSTTLRSSSMNCGRSSFACSFLSVFLVVFLTIFSFLILVNSMYAMLAAAIIVLRPARVIHAVGVGVVSRIITLRSTSCFVSSQTKRIRSPSEYSSAVSGDM